MKKRLLVLVVILLCIVSTEVDAKTLDKKKTKTADKIAEICIENWEEYGVLPSVAVAQAFIESTLGKNCSGYNLWGVKSGKEQYSSLKEGTLRYLEVINNGYYEGAPFQKNYKKQLKAILDGGYCQPAGNYYANAIWSIETYGFDKYDKELFRRLKWREKFTLIYDPSVPDNKVAINESIIKGGTVQIREVYVFYDVIPGGKGNKIKVNKKKWHGKKVHLDVWENAVG